MLTTIITLWEKYYTVFLQGLAGTIYLSVVSVLCASLIGTLLALMLSVNFRPFHILYDGYITLVRGTPILLQLYFFWLLLPAILPIDLSETACVVVALIINATSFVAETVRAGVQSVDIGQTEAAKSLGLSKVNTMTHVILPQAIKNILPALGNQYIMMIKQTSLASVFFTNELMTSFKTVQSATFLALPSLIIVGIIYLILITVLTKALAVFERRLQANER